jgi:uncharacterized protein YegL
MGITLDKVQSAAPELVSLYKDAQASLNTHGLTNATARVALVLDHSGSISGEYSNGSLQKLAERVLGLASHLDDDGQVDVFFFDSKADYAGEISIDDYQGRINHLRRNRQWGLTYYGLAVNKVTEHFNLGKKGLFGKKKAVETPVFVVFLTDGKPSDPNEAMKIIRETSNSPVFFKFLSIGPHIQFLQDVDDMQGRPLDNTDYKSFQNLSKVSDQELFDALLDEYPQYLTDARNLGILK